MPQDTAEFIKKLQSRPLEELHLITPEYLMPYLHFVKEHRRIFRAAIEHSSALGMDDAYLALNRHIFTPILDRFHIPPSERKYIMPFYIHGLMAIIQEWLQEDCKDSVEHLVSVMRICIPPREP